MIRAFFFTFGSWYNNKLWAIYWNPSEWSIHFVSHGIVRALLWPLIKQLLLENWIGVISIFHHKVMTSMVRTSVCWFNKKTVHCWKEFCFNKKVCQTVSNSVIQGFPIRILKLFLEWNFWYTLFLRYHTRCIPVPISAHLNARATYAGHERKK